MTKKIWFIVNPIAGVKSKKHIEPLIDKILDHAKFTYKVLYTNGPKHGKTLAAQGVKEGIDLLVAVGGDGTIHEVGQALVDSKSTLAIIPCGSGNGFARHLGIPLNIKKALECINASYEILIDTIQINEEYYFNVAGIGFDAHIAHLYAKSNKRGFSSYLFHAVKEFIKYKSQKYSLTVDGNPLIRDAFLLCFANTSQWGNNAYIAPKAKISDGVFDIVILKKFPKYHVFCLLFKLFKGSIDSSKYVESLQAKEVIFNCQETCAHIDGEAYSIERKTKFSVKPASLRVILRSGTIL